MKNFPKIRIAALLLAAACLIPAMMSGCGTPDDVPKTETTEQTSTQAVSDTDPAETTPPDIYADLPNEKYDGDVFSILTCAISWTAYENMKVDSITGEQVNDKIYARNTLIEETLGITIDETVVADETAAKTGIIAANTDQSFDMVFLSAPVATNYAIEGLLFNLGETPINFEKPWWDNSYNASANITDESYIAFGDISLSYVGGTFCLAFNPDLVTKLGIDSPYDLYDNDNWTYETMFNLTEAAKQDEDGDKLVSSLKEDVFGLVGHVNQVRHIIMSSGASVVVEKDGIPVMNITDTQYASVYSDVMKKFVNVDGVVWASKTAGYSEYNATTTVTGYAQIFNEGRSLFIMDLMSAFKDNRESEVPYKIIELPKYNKTQKTYYNVKYVGCRGISLPAGADDEAIERNSTIIEYLGAYSHRDVIPAFVEITLYCKYAKDEKSNEMMDTIMRRPGFCDVAFLYDWANINALVQNMNIAGRTEVSATFKTIETKFNNEVKSMIDKFGGK